MPKILTVKIERRPMCLHCKQHPQARGRGLCTPCYYDRSIRAKYPKRFRKPISYTKQHHHKLDEPMKCGPDELPCVAAPKCRNVIKVELNLRDHLVKLGFPWRVCQDCADMVKN